MIFIKRILKKGFKNMLCRSIVIIGCAMFLFVGCSASDPGTNSPSDMNIIGKWVIIEVNETKAVSDRNWYQFNNDGSLNQSSGGYVSEGSWVLNGNQLHLTVLDDDPDPATRWNMEFDYGVKKLDSTHLQLNMGGIIVKLELQ